MVPTDDLAMTCESAALSLLLGEDPIAVDRAKRHQSTCPICGVAARPEVPERLRHALPSPPRWLIWVLIVLGVAHAIVAIPWMIGSDPFGLLGDSVPPTHATRDGAIGIVIAVAAIMAALRPRWARPGFLIASAALIAQAGAGLADSSIADTGASEVVHLLSVVLAALLGVCVLTQIVRPLGPTRRPPLRSVELDD